MSEHVFGQWYRANDPPKVAEGSSTSVIGAFWHEKGWWGRTEVEYFNNYPPDPEEWDHDDPNKPGPFTGFAEPVRDDDDEYISEVHPRFWMPMPPAPIEPF